MTDEIDMSWMTDGTSVLYFADWPPRNHGEGYIGQIDGEPKDISRDPGRKHFVVRLRNMDSRFQKKFGRNVASVVDVKFIQKAGPTGPTGPR